MSDGSAHLSRQDAFSDRLRSLLLKHEDEGLGAVLAAYSDFIANAAGPEALAVLNEHLAALRADGVGEASPEQGQRAPDISALDVRGREVLLSQDTKRDLVVLVFYRGGWCPYCNAHLAFLQRALADMTDAGATLIAVSPELPDHALNTADSSGLDFRVVSDRGNAIASSYGLVFDIIGPLKEMYISMGLDLDAINGHAGFRLPIPATFLLGEGLSVLERWIEHDYRTRVDPRAILDAITHQSGKG